MPRKNSECLMEAGRINTLLCPGRTRYGGRTAMRQAKVPKRHSMFADTGL